MNISNILSQIPGRVFGAKAKAPLLIFLALLLRAAMVVVYYLLFLVLGGVGYYPVVAVLEFFDTIAGVALLALGVYLILLFVKGKKPLHLVGGILVLVHCVVSGGLVDSFLWLGAGVCMAFLPLRSENEDDQGFAKLTLCAVLVETLFGLLGSVVYRLPWFLFGLYMILRWMLTAVELLLLMVVVLRDADLFGGVKDTVDELVEKAKTKGAEFSKERAEKAEKARAEKDQAAAETADTEVTRSADTAAAVAAGTAAMAAGAAAVAAGAAAVAAAAEASGEEIPAAAVIPEAVASAVSVASAAGILSTSGKTGSGRYQYKTVAGPVGLTIAKKDSYSDGVKQYAALIDQESVGGWALDSIHEIPVTKKAGCIAGLLGQPDVTVYFNMLIFYKED